METRFDFMKPKTVLERNGRPVADVPLNRLRYTSPGYPGEAADPRAGFVGPCAWRKQNTSSSLAWRAVAALESLLTNEIFTLLSATQKGALCSIPKNRGLLLYCTFFIGC